MKPGDTVSLIVRGRNPLEPQKFVDVGSLLMELQKAPAAADGSYHVFLAPPDFPSPAGGQKFDVTYVGAPQREPSKDPRNPHPPLFVAPLNYSVPQGYGRVQIPTRNVKFALTNPFGVPPPQQQQQQPNPFQQSFRQPQAIQLSQQQPQIKPVPPFQPIQPPAVNQLKQSGQFLPPQPVVAIPPPPQPQFQPVPSAQPTRFQPIQPQPQQQRPEIQRPPVQQPSTFEQSLSDVRIQTGFVPIQSLEEVVTTPPPRPREPLVLAVESPEFLKIGNPPPPPAPQSVLVNIPAPNIPATEAPQLITTTSAPVLVTEKIAKPVKEVPAPVTLVPPPEDFTAPTPAFEETIQAASPIPAPDVTDAAPSPTVPPTVPSSKKRPSIRIPVQGGAPQWPDFQSVRQRQQLQRQQNNRKKTTTSSSNSNSFREAQPDINPSDIPLEVSFGQKIKVKTNALVSPPAPVESKATVQQLESFDIDPPVVERDEAFQTLESQNSANAGQRGRIRFNRPVDVNAIPAEASTAPSPPSARQTVSTLVGGRNRFRIATTTAAPEVTEEPVEDDVVVRGDGLPLESGSQVEQEGDAPVAADEESKLEEPAEEKPWSPYEAIQRQRESTLNEPEAESQVFSNSGQPIRNRGKTTFSSSRIPLPPVVRPDVGNRQIVLRPAATIRRPSSPNRLTKPVLQVQEVTPSLQEEIIPPAAPGFGVRDGGVESNQPAQLPVGRRVPEIRRPGLQVIPIGRPSTTTTEAPVVDEEVVVEEEDPAAVGAGDLVDETEELVTEDPVLVNDQGIEEEVVEEGVEEEPLLDAVEGEEEVLIDETEGQLVEEFDETSAVDQQPEVEQQIDGVVGEQVQSLAESVTTAPSVVESGSIEASTGNSVDDSAKQSEVLGVSTATEVSLMYELCYRGRCVRVHE